MPYYAPLPPNTTQVCNMCKNKAEHLWQSITEKLFPKCTKHMEEAQEREDEYNNIPYFQGENEYGEHFDEDSY